MAALPPKCPAGCGRVQQRGKFLCLPCWRLVPEPLQRAIYDTWRVYKSTSVRDPLFPERSRAYRAARAAALEELS